MVLTLLIVDDDDLILRAVGRMLKREAVDAVLVDDPAKALALCRERGFDVVVSDFMMPKMTGPALLRELRALQPSSVRMLLTAYPDAREISDAVDDGTVQCVLEKPFKMAKLTQALVGAGRDARA